MLRIHIFPPICLAHRNSRCSFDWKIGLGYVLWIQIGWFQAELLNSLLLYRNYVDIQYLLVSARRKPACVWAIEAIQALNTFSFCVDFLANKRNLSILLLVWIRFYERVDTQFVPIYRIAKLLLITQSFFNRSVLTNFQLF